MMMLGTFPSLANTLSLLTVSWLPTISWNEEGRYFSIHGTSFSFFSDLDFSGSAGIFHLDNFFHRFNSAKLHQVTSIIDINQRAPRQGATAASALLSRMRRFVLSYYLYGKISGLYHGVNFNSTIKKISDNDPLPLTRPGRCYSPHFPRLRRTWDLRAWRQLQ